MTHISPFALIGGQIIPFTDARLSIASSSVLYGLSVYSVVFLKKTAAGFLAFRLSDHLKRIEQSARLIGFSDTSSVLNEQSFTTALKALLNANQPATSQFCRITLHISEEAPGVRTRNLAITLSAFMYEAMPILPATSTRLKTSLWRRTADTAIPARAKVNGAYVNSALAKQEALDCGFDDCLFLNQNGYVSELSAANIFFVKRGELITPDLASDILEGITRRSIIELAQADGIPVIERKVALTELYVADEVFACGTSAFISPVSEIDSRPINKGQIGTVTTKLKAALNETQSNPKHEWITVIG